jgi:cell division protein DivIC
MKERLKRIANRFRNKYLVSLVVFIVWLMFFDQDNMIERYKALQKLNDLQEDKIYYQKKVSSDSLRLEELKSDTRNLEKFAREQYLMKKNNEDIFIIKEDD